MSSSSGLGGPLRSNMFGSRRRRLRTMPFVQQFQFGDKDDAGSTVMEDWFWGRDLEIVASGQYESDQSTPIAVGATTANGITTNLWYEASVYTNQPISQNVSLNIENEALATGLGGTPTAITWSYQFKTPFLPTSRRGSCMVYDAKNARFILFGGYDGTARNNEAWELSAGDAYHRWRKIIPSGTPPTAKNLAAGVYVRGTTSGAVDKAYMVVFGGTDGTNDLNEMHTLDLTTPGKEAWVTITQTNAPAVRSYIIQHIAPKKTGTNTTDLYLFGGDSNSVRINDMQRCTFNVNTPTAVTWTALKANGTAGNATIRSGASMVYDSLNDRMVIACGYNGTSWLNDVWQYNITGNSFSSISVAGTAPAIRETQSMAYDPINQRAIIIGGWQGSSSTARNDVFALSLTSGSETWTSLRANDIANQGVIPFSNAACAVDTTRNMMVMAMMFTYDSTDKYVYAFNMNDTSGTPTVYSLNIIDYFRARDAPATCYNSTSGELVIINGYSGMDDDTTIADGDHVSDVWAYDRTNNKLRYAAKGPYNIPQNEGGLAVYDSLNDRIIYFGGLTGSAQRTNDVWQLKANSSGMYVATKLSPSGTKPAQRWLMAGCYDSVNQRMVIWGGQNAGGILSDTWSLSLVSGAEAWTQLTPTGTAPTAVWQPSYAYDTTNKRLYIHGGATNTAGTTYSSQLVYLNLSTTNGAWTITSATGGLAVRGATLGFDNGSSRLVCFGGYDGTSVNNTLRYISTAALTTWLTQIAPNTPAARRSAAWGVMGSTFVVACGRPATGEWFRDIQELNFTAGVSAWRWTERDPDIFQMMGINLTGLVNNTNYHWQAWATIGMNITAAQSFGGNLESEADYIVSNGLGGQIKVYNGSSWNAKPVKVWNGSSWDIKPLKRWDGSAWVETSY